MLNRETGVKPVLSRSCNAEQALKCHWVKTGKASDEAEPEELPDYSPLRSCERQEWSVTRAFYAFLSLCAEKRFLFCFYFSGTRNPVSSVRKTKDIKII